MSSDLKVFSSELTCWLTADWVTWLICAAFVKLSVSAKSQKTLRLSICISRTNTPGDPARQGILIIARHLVLLLLTRIGRDFDERRGQQLAHGKFPDAAQRQ